MADEFLKTDPEADDQELIVESKRAINYLQVQRNYRYVEFLAQGGYGWVSLVYDDTEKRPLAIKCTVDTSEMELSWWPKLQHDTILPLIEYITLDSCTVFIMPAMRKDLWMCVTEPQFYQDELSFGLCRIWLGDVATALDYLHNQQLCHLDLKLDNIFLKDNGRACLGDFSLLSDSKEVPIMFNFLELYEPPEYTDWCHGKPPSAIADAKQFSGDKADMWQYGILSLDLLTNLSLSGKRSNYFTLWHHDVWPFVQKVLQHKEYMEYLLEDTFQNVFFNDLDFDLCHEFLEQLLIIEPNVRASAAEAMRHEFVNVEWPHIPSSFGMPKKITAHPSKPRPKEEKKESSAEGDVDKEGKPVEESTSQMAADVLKKKKEKLQKEKQDRRQSFAAIAGKNPLVIRSNISGMEVGDRSRSQDLNDVDVQKNAIVKKSVETNKKNSRNTKKNTRRVSIAPNKKLQAKVNNDPAKLSSSQLGRSNRSSSEQVTRFLSSSSRNVKGKSPVRKTSDQKDKTSRASKSPSAKKSPNNRSKSPISKKSPSGSKKSSSSVKSKSSRRESKSPLSKKSSSSPKVKTSQDDEKKKSGIMSPKDKTKTTEEGDATNSKTSSQKNENIQNRASNNEQGSGRARQSENITKGKTSPHDEDKTSIIKSDAKDTNPKKSNSIGEETVRKVSSHDRSHQNIAKESKNLSSKQDGVWR